MHGMISIQSALGAFCPTCNCFIVYYPSGLVTTPQNTFRALSIKYACCSLLNFAIKNQKYYIWVYSIFLIPFRSEAPQRLANVAVGLVLPRCHTPVVVRNHRAGLTKTPEIDEIQNLHIDDPHRSSSLFCRCRMEEILNKQHNEPRTSFVYLRLFV